MLSSDVPIDFRQKNQLVTGPRHLARQILQKRYASISLRGGNSASRQRGQFCCAERRNDRTRSSGVGHCGKPTQLLISAKEKEELVLDDRAADAAAKLMTLIRRQEGNSGGHSIHEFRFEGEAL